MNGPVFFCRLSEPNSYLSNWYPTPFTHRNVSYPTVEHYMMYGKALLMGDLEMALQILAATTPNQVKALGRKVRNYQERLWQENRFTVVLEGCFCKFMVYPDLRKLLFETGDRLLVEAASYDKIWGIGLNASDLRAQNPATWKGQNLLGQVLMKVREVLRRMYPNE